MGITVEEALAKRKKKKAEGSSSGISVEEALAKRQQRIRENLDTTDSELRTEYNSIVEGYNSTLERANSGYGQKALAEELTTRRLATDKIVGLKKKYEEYRSYLGDEYVDSYISSLDDILAGYGSRSDVAMARSKFETKEEFDEAYKQSGWYQKYSDMDADARQAASERLSADIDGVRVAFPGMEDEYGWLSAYNRHTGLMDFDVEAARAEIEQDERTAEEHKETEAAIADLEAFISKARDTDNAFVSDAEKRLEELYKLRDSTYLTSSQIAEKRMAMKEAEDYQALQGYYALVDSADFDEMSRPKTEYATDQTYAQITGVKPETLRDSILVALGILTGEGVPEYYSEHYNDLTEDEKRIYTYLYNKEGADSAKDFLDTMAQTIESRVGQRLVEADMNPILLAGAAGLSNPAQAIEGIIDRDSAYVQTGLQTAAQQSREELSGLGKLAYDTVYTTANMVPSLAIGGAVGLVNPALGQWVSSGLMGLGAGGNAYAEALRNGYSQDEAVTYGVLTGVSEAVLEKFVGGVIPFDKAGAVIGKWKNAIARVVGRAVVDSASEAVEEGLQSVLEQTVIRNIAFGEKNGWDSIDWEESLYNSLIGAISGLGFGAMKSVRQEISDNSRYSALGEKLSRDDLFGSMTRLVDEVDDAGKPLTRELRDAIAYGGYSAGKNNTPANRGRFAEKISDAYTAESLRELETVLTDAGYSPSIAKAILGIQYDRGIASTLDPESGNFDETLYGIAMETVYDPESSIGRRSAEFAKAITPRAVEPQAVNSETATEDADVSEGVTENAVQSDYEAPEAVPVTVKSTGVTARIDSFDTAPDGTLGIRLDSGEVVSAKDVVFDYSDDAIVYEVIADMGVSAVEANALVSGYASDSDISATDYALGVKEAYSYGKMGVAKSALADTDASMLSQRQLDNAYEVGRMAGEAAVNTRKESSDETDKEGVRIRRSSKRNGGADSEGQVRTMEGDAGQNQTRRKGRNRPADEGTSHLTYAREKVSTRSLGIPDGSSEKSVRLVTGGETESMKKAKALASRRGLDAVFFAGDNLLIGDNIRARAFISGNKVYIRVDHPKYTADQLMRHEAGHDMIAKGEVDIDNVRERIIEMYGEENVDTIVDLYAQAYAGSELDADGVWEDVICDSLGDMNVFADVDSYGEIVGEFLEVLRDTTMAEAVPARAPPGEVAKASRETDSEGKSYWQIESDKDIFANLKSVRALQKAAYNFILDGDKGSKVTDIIDGEELEFIRISAGEYVYGEDARHLTTEEYKQKMRMSTSIIDLIENAFISYNAPDHKKHKLFPNGFRNYQGRVGIDSTIFKYIVRVGIARDGMIFYDICLEVDGKVPRAKRTSLIKTSTSKNNIPQSKPKVKRNNGKTSREIDAEYLSAVESGDMATAQRLVGEAAKNAGYDRLFYHGARKGGGFTKFRDWSYFTENKQYAERYANREKEGSLYTTYVKLEKPFDTRSAKDRKLFYEIRQEYGLSEIDDSGLPDWTDGYDIAEYIDESGFDYDGIILDEGGDLVDGKPVSRGLSYVVRKSAQIKSAEPVVYDDEGNVIPLSERFNPEKSDIRYSREVDVEGLEDSAISHFGRTFYWKETGYLLPDGRKLDFSGKHNGGRGGYRSVDHREILEIYPEDAELDGNEAMVNFMSRGNIRIMPEGYGINLQTKPTAAQAEALVDFISSVRGEVYVDIDNEHGETVESIEYSRGTRASKVLADINSYFENGVVPEMSDIARFHSGYFSREVDTSGVRIRGKDESVYDILGESERLEAENEKLRGDVDRLRELVKLQRTLTHGQLFTKTSIDTAAKVLMEKAGVKTGKTEIMPKIEAFFRYIAKGEDLVWDEVMSRASDVASDIVARIDNTAKPEARFKEIADGIRTVSVSLTSAQEQEVASSYGSVNDFRKSNFGKIRLSKNGVPLDVQWQEWSGQYPELFDADTPEGDMPARLVEIADAVRETSEIYSEYEMSELTREIAMELYDLYWRATTVKTFADRKQQEINKLKAKHYREMTDLRQSRDDKVRATAQYYREMVAKVRANKDAKIERMKEGYRQSREKARIRRVKSEIKRRADRLVSMMLNPTDGRYVPAYLIEAVAEVARGVSYGMDAPEVHETGRHAGKPNKALAKRKKTKETLTNLMEQYAKMGEDADNTYNSEYDKAVYKQLTDFRNMFGSEARLDELTLEQLKKLDEILHIIGATITDARKLIGETEMGDIYEAGDTLMDEMNEVDNMGGKALILNKAKAIEISAMRLVRAASGYKEGSVLYRLFKALEDGARKKSMFIMEAQALFEPLVTGKNERNFYEATHTYAKPSAKAKPFTWVDKDGKRFSVSKMQMMQAILTLRREIAEDYYHIRGSGLIFSSIEAMNRGDYARANSAKYYHKVGSEEAVHMIEEFENILKNDTWAQEYMKTAQYFFNVYAKDAINGVSMQTKHRKIATEEEYIPYEVSDIFRKADIEGKEMVQKTLEGLGMLKQVQTGTENPLVIAGLGNVLERHINDVAGVYGLMIPVRNINKVWNVSSPRYKNSVRASIERVWGEDVRKYIEQAVRDVQSPPVKEKNVVLSWIENNLISQTFLLNLSVLLKQIGSRGYAASRLSAWNGSTARSVGDFIYAMFNGRKILEESKKYTATLWERQQGLTNKEVATLRHTAPGVFKKFFKALGYKVSDVLSEVTGKDVVIGGGITPDKFIQWMDFTVAASLWRAARAEVKKSDPSLKGEALLEETARFYDDLIANTQSVNDVLHTSQAQRHHSQVYDPFFLFKNDVFQMSGDIQDAVGAFVADKSKENGTRVARTLGGAVRSLLWTSAVTMAMAFLRRKEDEYRDKETGYLTWESMGKSFGFNMLGEVMSLLAPVGGSEAFELVSNIANKTQYDIVENMAFSAINDAAGELSKIFSNLDKYDFSTEKGLGEFGEDIAELLLELAPLLGIPANNIKRTIDAMKLHIEDISDGGNWFSSGVELTKKQKLNRIVGASDMESGQNIFDAVVSAATEDKYDNLSEKNEAIPEHLRKSDDELMAEARKEALADMRSLFGDLYKEGVIDRTQAEAYLHNYFDLTESEVYWTLDRWDYMRLHGTSEGYSKYNSFYDSVMSGEGLKDEIERHVSHAEPKEDEKPADTKKRIHSVLASEITSHFKPLMLASKTTAERANIKARCLTAYVALGYKRSEMNQKINDWLKD